MQWLHNWHNVEFQKFSQSNTPASRAGERGQKGKGVGERGQEMDSEWIGGNGREGKKNGDCPRTIFGLKVGMQLPYSSLHPKEI